MINKKPSFKQQWILSMIQANVLYVSILYTDSFSPFRGEYTNVINQFLRRMEQSGWLDSTRSKSFYELTIKSLEWKKENKDKDSLYYYNEYEKKRIEKYELPPPPPKQPYRQYNH